MAKRRGVQSSSESSGEDEVSEEGAKLYCEALTKLIPDILPVLETEVQTILTSCHSRGLVGKDMYTSGITLQESPSKKASLLLNLVMAQIKLKPSFCRTFLKILRNMPATEHIAERIKEEVARLQKQQVKRRQRLACKKKSPGQEKSPGQGLLSGFPKLDLHEDDYSSGFDSEYSTKVAGDSGTPPNHTPALQSANVTGDDVETPESQAGGELIYVPPGITTTPQQDNNMGAAYLPFTGCSEVGEETSEENRSIQTSEKISSGVAESVPYMRSDSNNTRPVYSSQVKVGEGFDNIHRVVEEEKRKAHEVMTEKDDTIFRLQNQLRIKENEQSQERKQHEEEMKVKEKELFCSVADIEQKSKEIEHLKKTHQQMMKALEDSHRAKVEKITSELEEKSRLAQQKMDALKLDLKKARDEKIALEKQRSEAEEEIEKLKLEHQQNLQVEKNNYESEIKNLKASHDSEIRKLEEQVEKERSEAKHKEDYISMSHKYKLSELENRYKDEISTLKERIHQLRQEKTEADAQAKICEAKMETQRERAEKERVEMQAQVDAKEAEVKIHRAESQNQLALREQAQEHDKEKKEILTTFYNYNAQRSISSSSGGSVSNQSVTEEITAHFMHLNISRTSTNNSASQSTEGSKQQTPSEEEEQLFCENCP